ncbi:MAG: hypothetical protein ABI388_11490 [Bacteroidia bacterium]
MKKQKSKPRLPNLVCAFLVLLSSCNNANEVVNTTITPAKAKEEAPSLLVKHPLLSWARKTPVEIGCMLEQELGHKDSIFNCSYKNYINKGDPCKNIAAYYEGIVFPNQLASKIDTSIAAINLDFEHGNLREITIDFKDNLLVSNLIKKFKLPELDAKLPDSVMAISYGPTDKPISNQSYTKQLVITAFDHIGAGDVDCN